MDVFLWEVYENSKKICLTKGTSRGLYDWRVCIEWSIFFLFEFLGKDFEDGPCFWDEEWASDIIDGEKPQYNGVPVEISK